jgi:hypothetical protein
MSCFVSETSLATFSVFRHYKLEHLDWPLELDHVGGTIISAIQFYAAWKVLITAQVDLSDHKRAAPCLRGA